MTSAAPTVDGSEELPDPDEFRRGARAVLEALLPRKGEAPSRGGSPVERARELQRALADSGYAGITWPTEYGGRGLPSPYQRLLDDELRAFQAPPKVLDIGLGMCGPAILAHGSHAVKARFVPPLLRGDHVWCELFSEPGAGSDLASVQMRATPDGDEWVLDGQKVWTSGAQHSDRAACIARTDPDRPKHDGITMFLVDMHAPGVTVRPLRQLTGEAHFNEVFLEQVRVPAADVLGEVHDGWRVARTVLAFERQTLGAMGSAGGGGRGGGFAALVEAARARDLLGDPAVRQRLTQLSVHQQVLRHLTRAVGAGGGAPLVKLAMARVVKETAEVAADLAGPAATAWDADDPAGARWSHRLLDSLSSSIGGGTDEVIRNVIGERLLGLPRDVEVDLDVPFRELKVGTQRDR